MEEIKHSTEASFQFERSRELSPNSVTRLCYISSGVPAQCSGYGGYREITGSSNVEGGCCLDE
ncbi:hypothetical protein J6590_085092 [Homalodisca vitripennis]|nr:hypothetical protein J6590_085092 [Homalodisca vitripennis]